MNNLAVPQMEIVNAKRCAALVGMSHFYVSAVKKAMGITARYFSITDFQEWVKANKDFRISDVYPRKPSPEPSSIPKGRRSAIVGKRGGR